MTSAYQNIEEVKEALLAARNNDLYDQLWEVRYSFPPLNNHQVSINKFDCLPSHDVTELSGQKLQKP